MCVAESKATSIVTRMHLNPITMEEQPLLIVTGISLTHGIPRQHIWTFAASASDSLTNFEACPCNATTYNSAPSFVGEDYFCESGTNSGSRGTFYPDDLHSTILHISPSNFPTLPLMS